MGLGRRARPGPGRRPGLAGAGGEEAVLQRDDADLARLALADLGDLLGRELRPVAVRVVRWGGGLPQPAVGHVDSMERAVAAVAALPGLALAGATVGGVGIPACIATATRAADAVLAGGRRVRGAHGEEEYGA